MEETVMGPVLLFMLIGLFAVCPPNAEANQEKAIFAGGCFWCMEPAFSGVEGVQEVKVGYTGGTVENPSYEQVSLGKTGHLEAIQIIFDPMKISYQQLLDIFWRQIDPTDPGGQFADRGTQYKTAIFYLNAGQKHLAEVSKLELERSHFFPKPITTQILPARTFYAAENYHQRYFVKQPERYKQYRLGSGRETYLKSTWAAKKKNRACVLNSISPAMRGDPEKWNRAGISK